MFRKVSPERIAHLRSLPPLEAVRLIVTGEFVPGEDDYLVDAIRDGADVSCSDEEMWEILYDAMDNDTDPNTVLGRLVW